MSWKSVFLRTSTSTVCRRYVPNLVARPFELTDNFLDAMIERGHMALEELRPNLTKNGRAILIELLAWQFASPVRWIETQEYLNETIKRTIEVGPKSSPVLSNMFMSGYRNRKLNIECLHAARDADQVLGAGIIDAVDETEATSEAATTAPTPAPMQEAASVAAATKNTSSAQSLEDEPWSITRSLFAL